jgi:hypothetical protein
MGFRISWIGFQGVIKDQALERLDLRDTGELDEANEAPFSAASIPGEWFILFSNDFLFASSERLVSLSRDCRTLACQVHEGIMVSNALSYERGVCVWQIMHNHQNGPDDLSVTGSPPEAFRSIRDRLMQLQDEQRGRGVDYVFDVPVETAAKMCGYRHDRVRFEWGKPNFTRLELARR